MNVIYADVLFVINFSMDFLALFIAGVSLHCVIRPKRLAASALLGAGFATIAALFDRDDAIIKLVWMLAFIGCAAAMCAISFDCRIIRCICVFTGVNLGLGGTMSALLSALRSSGYALDGSVPSIPTLIALALISAAVSLLYGRVANTRRREVVCRIDAGASSGSFRLLVDSGNLLCEPIGGLPVVIIRPSELFPALDIAAAESRFGHLRVIPASSVTGARMICGFIPDRVEINGKSVAAVIAPVEGEYGGCEGLVPDILI